MRRLVIVALLPACALRPADVDADRSPAPAARPTSAQHAPSAIAADPSALPRWCCESPYDADGQPVHAAPEPVDYDAVALAAIEGPVGFGLAAFPVDDVDGDGLRDVVVAQEPDPFVFSDSYEGVTHLDESGSVWLIPSASRGTVAREGASLAVWRDEDDAFGRIVPIGDVDGGGAGDFWVHATRAQEALLLPGEARGERTRDEALGVVDLACGGCTFDLAPLPDLDGDGARELAIGGARASVFAGGTTGRHGLDAARTTLSPPPGGYGVLLSEAGDLDGDGRAEAIATVGSPSDGAWWLPELPAGAVTLEATPDAARAGPVEPLGDVDGDGRDEVAIGLAVFHGSAGGLPANRIERFESGAIRALGDVDGDGFADLSVGGTDAVYVLHGPTPSLMDDARPWFELYTVRGDGFRAATAVTVEPLGDIDGDRAGDVLLAVPGFYYPVWPRDGGVDGPGTAWFVPGSALW